MITHHSLEKIPVLSKPTALAIGTFDGVHLGHQHLFQELKKHGLPVLLTFSNHPAEILRPTQVPSPILTLSEKINLFRQFGIAMTIVVPFTETLSTTPYDQFLEMLPFSTLVGGEDLRLGAGGLGTKETIPALGYKTIFLPKYTFDGSLVSSRLIRELIKNRQFDQAKKLLGHNKGSLWLDSRAAL
jgi:riboflavin kinase/FMN adenylyltransferase